ncbi:MAG TPA: hypothetical protein DEQ26_10785 [Flavobacteriaceae bacterium]|nr:hypothetical protein [Flavobacteriaceae bacterium]
MNVKFTSLHQIDHIEGITEIDISNQSSDLKTYVNRLFEEITTSNSNRQFEFKSQTTEVRNALSKFINDEYDDASKINSDRLLNIEISAQAAISHLNVDIQKGSLFQAVIEDENNLKSIIISKADHNEYLDEIDFTLRKGLPWKKRIFKAFLVKFDSENNPTNIYVYDTNQKISKYWWDSFLELKEKYTDSHNTKMSLDMIDKKIFSKIKSDHPEDYYILRNSAVRYFRSKSDFELEDFINDTFNNYLPINSDFTTEKLNDYKSKIRELPDKWKFDSRFSIKKEDVNKRVSNRFKLTETIDLILKDYVPNIEHSIVSEIDEEGVKWVKIKSDLGYEQFKKL